MRQCAAKIGEPVHCTKSLTVDCDVGLNIGFPWGRLVQYFSLLYADGETEVCAGYGKFVYAALHVSFSAGVEGTVISKQEVPDDVCLDLGFCLKPPEVEQLAICTVPEVDFNVTVSESVCQHCGKHEAEQCWC